MEQIIKGGQPHLTSTLFGTIRTRVEERCLAGKGGVLSWLLKLLHNLVSLLNLSLESLIKKYKQKEFWQNLKSESIT